MSKFRRVAMLASTLWRATGCCNSCHDQELWGWVGEMTGRTVPELQAASRALNWQQRGKKKNNFAQGLRFSVGGSSTYKYVEVQVFMLEFIKNWEVEDDIFGYWLDHFVWLKLMVALWLGLFSCRRNPFWQLWICDHSCVSFFFF